MRRSVFIMLFFKTSSYFYEFGMKKLLSLLAKISLDEKTMQTITKYSITHRLRGNKLK